MIFNDRRDAGRHLAAALKHHLHPEETMVVLGIPRGGVVVAAEVAGALGAELDVVIARKIRAPDQPELGIGAVVDGAHITILNDELVRLVGASREDLDREIALQSEEIDRRLLMYRGKRPAVDISGQTAIVIDDGIATGYTFRAALEGLRQGNPRRLIAAAPVAAADSARMLRSFADQVVCLNIPEAFMAVGYWYRDFQQVSDEEVVDILRRFWSRPKRNPEVPPSKEKAGWGP
ncbi:MAG: phosphoribosyltransferase [Deltaproteobacteria bacterium]|nr:phosphoribosyltransferase [Deltaproteobacteria bacterium]